MSHKQAKRLRSQIKNYPNNMQDPQGPQYSFKQLETFIALSVFLTGKKPEKLELTEKCYNWYVQEVNSQAEAMGLKPGFKNDKPTFMGLPIEKRVNIAVPETPKVITPEEIKAN